MSATGDGLKATKAVYAGVVGFLAPGAAYLAGVADNGVTSNELIIALCFCIGGAVVLGGGTYGIENKPKTTPPDETVTGDYWGPTGPPQD